MSKEIKRRGGTSVEHDSFIGASKELTVDTTNNTIRLHDSVTPGGHKIDPYGNRLTTEGLINGVIKGFPAGHVLITTGFYSTGDGGSGSWKKTGSSGLSSQSPSQLGGDKLTDHDGNEWELVDELNVKKLGAKGDYDITLQTGTDDTDSINAAINSWVSKPGSRLYFPDSYGAYFYDGNKSIDLDGSRFNTWYMDGYITTGTTTGITFAIFNGRNTQFKLKNRYGGVLANFFQRDHVGSCLFQFHTMEWCDIDIESMSYLGRILHCTAGGTDQATRCRMMDISIKTGQRTSSPDGQYCGQPFFFDSGISDQVGAFGQVEWRGEGCEYGPVLQRLNDVRVLSIEAGKFVVTPPEIRGCSVIIVDSYYIGQTGVFGGANSWNLKVVADPETGRLNSDISFGKLRFLKGTGGISLVSFNPDLPGVTIDSCTGNEIDGPMIYTNSVPSLVVSALGGENITNLIHLDGDSTGMADITFTQSYNALITGDAAIFNAQLARIVCRGSIQGGAAGFSLISITGNREVELANLELRSEVCSQLVDITYAGANQIRHIGGSVVGASPTYGIYKPELIRDVRGHATETMNIRASLAGETGITTPHGCAEAPSFISLTAINPIANLRVTSITDADFTVAHDALSADASYYWKADATKKRGDYD